MNDTGLQPTAVYPRFKFIETINLGVGDHGDTMKMLTPGKQEGERIPKGEQSTFDGRAYVCINFVSAFLSRKNLYNLQKVNNRYVKSDSTSTSL